MQTYHFFKVNLASQGYKIIWSGDTPPLDLKLEIIDASLSHPAVSDSSPNVVYSAAKLGKTSILLSVGSYWTEYHDEYGRPGLSFWHGILCILPRINQEQTGKISDLLIQLIHKYRNEYDRFGEIIANLATQEQDRRWISTFAQLNQQQPSKLDENWENSIDKFVNSLSIVPARANLKMESPLRYEFLVPFLICLLLYQDDVLRVAGGTMAHTTPDQFQYISVPSNISGYREFDISEILQGVSASPANTSDSNRFRTEIDTRYQEKTEPEPDKQKRKFILFIIGASLIFCVLAILIFNVLKPETVSPTSIPLTATTFSIPATNIVVTPQGQSSPEPLPSSTSTWTPTATHQMLLPTPSKPPNTPIPEATIPFKCQSIVNPGERWHIILPGQTLMTIAELYYGYKSQDHVQNIYNLNTARGNPSVGNSINEIDAGGCLLIP